jgi:alginate O-acetyltransferase complex protein AlgI
MAVGISRLFGVGLPINFHSPYKAESIIEFGRRWHMSLSNFLPNYLYIPLGGNRHGRARRYANLVVTMLLGGSLERYGSGIQLAALCHRGAASHDRGFPTVLA